MLGIAADTGQIVARDDIRVKGCAYISQEKPSVRSLLQLARTISILPIQHGSSKPIEINCVKSLKRYFGALSVNGRLEWNHPQFTPTHTVNIVLRDKAKWSLQLDETNLMIGDGYGGNMKISNVLADLLLNRPN